MSKFWEVREDPEYYDEDPEVIDPAEWEDAFPETRFKNWVEVVDSVADQVFDPYNTSNS